MKTKEIKLDETTYAVWSEKDGLWKVFSVEGNKLLFTVFDIEKIISTKGG